MLTDTVHVIGPCAGTTAGEAVLDTLMTERGVIVVTARHSTLSTDGSVVAVPVQVFVIVPVAIGALPLMVIVLEPTAKLAREHVTVWPATPQLQPAPEAAIAVTPAGTASVTTTLVAEVGPWFWAVIVHVSGCPAGIVAAETTFESTISERGLTVVVDRQLVRSSVAPGAAVATHVLTMLPATVGALPVIAIELEPTGRDARLQVTVRPATPQVQPVPDAAIFVTPAGSVSVMTTLEAAFGPALVAVIVHVIEAPAITGFGLADLVKVTEERGVIVVVSLH